ncbi:MAG: pyruvate kinase [Oceanospirillaceae bacterium]|jgi:pyruvate kinase|nr:pyruvate kinase [Oceanospirillaceae bacterium]MBT4997697.1 pyruvate kinase [Oceanospirillaceae bacterium]MBT5630248.1 pyruvate kinase [Oceanospirillaceae bacterium]MBT6101508.1 pyruvate kinase [Oceanospirillaceae bacterium]MBT7673090.1 pyruvate kinase [Oceanospirillaceae bacterium]
MQLRRTKIVATLGPATSSPEVLKSIIAAGADVVRLNFSHGTPADHQQRAAMVLQAAKEVGRHVALLADLQGPKVRVARFTNNKVQLQEGQDFLLDPSMDLEAGTEEAVGLDFPELGKDLHKNDILLLDDGRIVLKVVRVSEEKVYTQVEIGGPLSNNKGINLQGGGLSAAALTPKDRADLITAAKIGVDYIAISFVRNAEDMHEARALLEQAHSNASLIAKIERAEAIDSVVLEGIIEASEGVMVARGDLAVEIGDALLVGVQKDIIKHTRRLNRIVITATQMMESMITSPMPTRAEVSDVANAVMDGTDAVMLSAETAVGDFPAQTVEAMARVCLGAEQHRNAYKSSHRVDISVHNIDESVALSAMYAANHLDGVKAIICMTQSGQTPLLMSRIRSGIPIFAFTPEAETQRRVCLYRGVITHPFDSDVLENSEVNHIAVEQLKALGVVKDGDIVLITKGDYVKAHGGTNTLKVVRVGNQIQ